MIRRIAALALAALATTGCIKLKHKTTVMPDGAGKFTLTVGMSKEMAEMMKGFGEALGGDDKKAKGLAGEKLSELAKAFEGAAALTPPKEYDKDEFHFTEVTAYFEDVTKFKFRKPEGGAAKGGLTAVAKGSISFKLEKAPDGALTLVADNLLLGDEKEISKKAGGDAPQSEEQKEMARAMLDGLEISETYELPGDVTSVEAPLTKTGRTAAYVITVDKILDDADGLKSKPPIGTRKVVAAKVTLGEEEVKVFRAELELAKKAWADALAAEAAKDAASKEPAAGDKPADEPAPEKK